MFRSDLPEDIIVSFIDELFPGQEFNPTLSWEVTTKNPDLNTWEVTFPVSLRVLAYIIARELDDRYPRR